MSPSHERVLCKRLKHHESPCRAVERKLVRGLLQLPKAGLFSLVDIVVASPEAELHLQMLENTNTLTLGSYDASLLAPCHHAKSLGSLDLPQLGSFLRRWCVPFLSMHWDLACRWLPAYRK